MSRTELKRWVALGLTAFALRAGIAVLTEYKPLFPDYYYHDAVFVERIAWDMAQTWRNGVAYATSYSPPQRAHAAVLALPYVLIGRHPLVNKLLNSALGAAALALFGLAVRPLFGEKHALTAAALVAVWPSHAFYTSQNFKESPTLFLIYGAFAALTALLASRSKPTLKALVAGGVLLALTGLLRRYVLVVAAASFACGALLRLRDRETRTAGALILLTVLAAPLIYRAPAYLLFERMIRTPPQYAETLPPMAPIVSENGPAPSRWSPAGISLRRAQGQASDRAYAQKSMGREVSTQILPDARFDTWAGFAWFMARAEWQVLFMPLPGLYPMEGKPGRWAAAAENVLLLLLALSAAAGALRARPSPARTVFLAFFLLMAAGSAAFEFDLGSASRHKLLYFPMLFPFAVEELSRWRRA